LQLQLSEQLEIFEDRVTIITNAIEQFHHSTLAVDLLLSPDQMEIMHNAVTKIAQKLSDYYQIEATFSKSEDDIVLMLHVPCIETTSLL
jgi:hypothetical protein